MEITKGTSIMHYDDPRQSDAWGATLKDLGWTLVRTKNGVQIALKSIFFGSVVKVQRPKMLTETDLDEIEAECVKRRALFIKIECYYGQDESIFEKKGYEVSPFPMCPTKTMFMNLTLSFDELWNNLSKSAKYSINRARREGAKLKFFRKPDNATMKEFYAIMKETGSRKHFYVPPIKEFLSRRDNFGSDCLLIMVYNGAGAIEGAKLILASGKNAVYISGGTTASGRKSKSGYLLTWETILYLKRLGYENLDLEGLDDPRFPSFTENWGGFAHFKEKFNGTVVTMPPPYIKYLSNILKGMARLSPLGL